MKFDTRNQLGKHLCEEHTDTSRTNKKDETIPIVDEDEESSLKEELGSLKKNFQRLEALFQDSLKEVDNVRSEYEAKLIVANDEFRVIKAENEELKEKVDVLLNLVVAILIGRRVM